MKVAIYHATAGYGHKKAAESIYHGLLQSGLNPEDIRIRDSLEDTPTLFRKLYPEIYYESVRLTPWLWGWFYELFDHPLIYMLVRPIRSIGNRLCGKKLIAEMVDWEPDAIVSTHFFTAQLFARAKREGRIKSKLITVITDFMPHTFWVNEGTDEYLVMESEGAEELSKRGIPNENIHVTGIPVDPVFGQPFDRETLLAKHQLSSKKTTLLVTSGGFGLGHYEDIISHLSPLKDSLQCILVCGNNHHEYEKCKKYDWPLTVRVYGFVDFMAELMAISDMILAKPGGATSAESLAMELPMMIFQPIPGQETRNAKILIRRKAGFPIDHPKRILEILTLLIEKHASFEETREQLKSLSKPNATQEIVEFIKGN